MRDLFVKYKHLLPVFLLVASFLSIFFKYDLYGYILLGNCVGWSILVSLYFIFEFTFNKKYCLISRISPVGLFSLNLIDVIGYYCNDNFYNFWYVLIVCSLIFSLSIIHYLNTIKR